jgi:hypothetical protein
LLLQKFLQVGQFHPDYSFLHKSPFPGMGSPVDLSSNPLITGPQFWSWGPGAEG